MALLFRAVSVVSPRAALGAPARRQARLLASSARSAKEALERFCKGAEGEGGIDYLLNKLDADSSGSVDMGELAVGLKDAGLNVSDAALEKLLKKYGKEEKPGYRTLKVTDLHKMLDAVGEHKFFCFGEGTAAAQRHYVFDEAGNFKDAVEGIFAKVDENGDGVLQPEELRLALAEKGILVDDDKLSHIFTLYDENGDGVLQLAEFSKLVDELDRESIPLSQQAR